MLLVLLMAVCCAMTECSGKHVPLWNVYHVTPGSPGISVSDTCLLPNLARGAFRDQLFCRGLGDGTVEAAVLQGRLGVEMVRSPFVDDVALHTLAR